MFLHRVPTVYKGSKFFSVTVNGEQADVFSNIVADFVSFTFAKEEGPVDIRVELFGHKSEELSYTIAPASRNITGETSGNVISFSLPRPEVVTLEVDGVDQPLLFFANDAETIAEAPDRSDPNVLYYAADEGEDGVHEVGLITLGSNQTLYIEPGAVVKGRIRVADASDTHITGCGVLDASFVLDPRGGPFDEKYSVWTDNSSNVSIEEITVINPPSWIVVLGGSDNIMCRNLKLLGFYVSTDGVDVVGSSNITIKDTFVRNNDDRIVIKSFMIPCMVAMEPERARKWMSDVCNVTAEKNTFMGYKGGCVFEIGHEIFCDRVDNIVFRDSDIISSHGFSACFSIQHTGRAAVSNVLYENINVDHCFDKMVNIRTMDSLYKYHFEYPEARDFGTVDGVTFRNIHWRTTQYNMGYTISLIGGVDPDHRVKNVTFDRFYVDDKEAKCIEDINIFTRDCDNIVFL